MSDYPLTHPDEVDHLLRNAQLRDELEPFSDESMQTLNMRRVPTPIENEFLASMLAWERAPVLSIAQWFTPELRLPSPESLSDDRLHQVLWETIQAACSTNGSCSISPTTFPIASFTGSSTAIFSHRPRRRSIPRTTTCTGTAPGPATTRKSGCGTTPTRKSGSTGWKRTMRRCRRASLRPIPGSSPADRSETSPPGSFLAFSARRPVDEARGLRMLGPRAHVSGPLGPSVIFRLIV